MAVDSGLTGSPSGSDLTGATVTISAGTLQSGDTLNFTNQNGISGSYSGGVLTLSGVATVAQYQTALQSVTFSTSSANTTTRSLSIVAIDGSLNSNPAAEQVSVSTTVPSLTPSGTTNTYTVGGSAVAVDSGLMGSPSGSDLTGATMTISAGTLQSGDTLNFTNQNGISGNYSGGVLTLSGFATVAQYQTALQSVTFSTTSTNTTTRSISVVAVDGSLDSSPAAESVNVMIAPPVVTPSGTTNTFTVGGAAVAVDSGVTVTSNDADITGATVTISAGTLQSGDMLHFLNQIGISGNYSGGVLNLSGSATPAQYQAALQAVTFSTTSTSTTIRSISIVAIDGSLNSSPAAEHIEIAIPAPIVTTSSSTGQTYTLGGAAVAVDSGVTVTSVDTDITGASMTMNYDHSGDSLNYTPIDGITVASNSGGVLNLTGSATPAQYTAALQSVTFSTTSTNTTARSVDVVAYDSSASTLYGMTIGGGANNEGTIFSIPVTGGTLTTLLSFNGTNGGYPFGDLTLGGSTLYGMTNAGGANDEGTIFSIPVTGGTPTTLLSFNGTNGAYPYGDLTLSGSTLYGMTNAGGANDEGTIFSIPVSGGTPTTLFSFNDTNGEYPTGSLTLSGSTLYGMTTEGGADNDGTIFSIPVTGGTPTILLSFNATNGEIPTGSLTLSGSTLYGMTTLGGVNNDGTIFSIAVTGGTATTLLSFNGTNGQSPYGDLTLSGSTLYGMTYAGGVNGEGTVFSIPVTGGAPTTLLSFNGTTGESPNGDLTLNGSTLYGMTNAGGVNGEGTIFSISVTGGTPTTLLSFNGTNGDSLHKGFDRLALFSKHLHAYTVGGNDGSGRERGIVKVARDGLFDDLLLVVKRVLRTDESLLIRSNRRLCIDHVQRGQRTNLQLLFVVFQQLAALFNGVLLGLHILVGLDQPPVNVLDLINGVENLLAEGGVRDAAVIHSLVNKSLVHPYARTLQQMLSNCCFEGRLQIRFVAGECTACGGAIVVKGQSECGPGSKSLRICEVVLLVCGNGGRVEQIGLLSALPFVLNGTRHCRVKVFRRWARARSGENESGTAGGCAA